MKVKVVKRGKRDQGKREILEIEGVVMEGEAANEANISNETLITLQSTPPVIR